MSRKKISFEIVVSISIIMLVLASISWSLESSYTFIFQIILILMLALYYKNTKVVLVFLIFSLPYLYAPKYYFWDGILLSAHSSYQNSEYLNQLVIYNMLFFVGFLLGLRKVNPKILFSREFFGLRGNFFAFFMALALMLYSLLFGIQGENIIVAGGYGRGDVEKNPLHEYFIVFYFASIIFADKKSNLDKYLIMLFMILYCLKTLIYGGRIEVVQIVLLTLLVFTNFFEKSNRLFYFLLAIGILLSNIVESFRQNPLLIFNPLETFVLDSSPAEVLASQYGDVNQASLRIIGLVSDGSINLIERFSSFIFTVFGSMHFIINPPDYWNLAAFKQSEARSGGGGLISAFSFAWLGLFGPILFGLLMGFIYRRLHYSNNIYILSYSLLIAISFPRWFAYYPAPIFKFCFLIVVILLLYKIVINVVKLGSSFDNRKTAR